MMSFKKEKTAPLFLFLSALLWSMSGIFTKSVAWNGLCLATLRGVIALVVSAFLIRGRKVQLNWKKILVGICYFAQGILFMSANKYTTAANATVLHNTSPLYIILFNALLAKKRPAAHEWVVCICLFGGISLAFGGTLSGGGMAGNIMALVSALFFAGVFFLSKEEGADPLESLVIGNGCYLLLLPVLVTNETVRNTPLNEWVFLLVFGTLTGIVAWLCFVVGIRYTSALQANFITMAESVMAPMWTFLFLHERISALSIIGCAIVIVTLLVYNVITIKRAPLSLEF
jgi:drug/metabolite transporter (DMT)-like permease